MASVYPGALDAFATNKTDVTGQATDHPAHHNNLADAINKIEAELGINPSGTSATVLARFALLQLLSEKGIANGYAALDGTGKVPAAQLPTATTMPAGAVTQYAGSGAPSGYLLCDGSAVSRATYSALFTAISTVYGAGDGTTTFNLPDFRGRMPVGVGTHTDIDVLGENEGAVLADRRPKHRHSVNDPGHSHTANFNLLATATGGGNTPGSPDATSFVTNTSVTGITVGQQANTPIDAPAYIAVNFIIKT